MRECRSRLSKEKFLPEKMICMLRATVCCAGDGKQRDGPFGGSPIERIVCHIEFFAWENSPGGFDVYSPGYDNEDAVGLVGV
jgi:hypothetical protein